MADKDSNNHIHSYHLELARMTTGLLIGVMALMTFLLTVGLQHPQKPFEPVFYTTVVLLGLSLILYVLAQALHTSTNKVVQKIHRIVHILQPVVFALSIIAVVALIFVSARIFFEVPKTPTGAGGM